MKLGIISPRYFSNCNYLKYDASRCVYDLTHGLVELGHDVQMFTYNSSRVTRKYKEGKMTVISIGGVATQSKHSLVYSDVAAWNSGVYDELEHEDTTTHLLVFDWFGYSAAVSHAERYGSKIIGFVGLLASGRGNYAPFTDKAKLDVLYANEIGFLAGCDHLVCFTNSSASEVKKLNPHAKIDVIRLGVNVPEVTRSPENGLVIGVGRISRDRCYELLIRGVEDIPWITTVKICGSGVDSDYGHYLLNVANKLDLKDKVELANIDSDKLKDVYRIAELSVCPSLYDPYGYSCLDSMASGVPVLARGVSYSDFVSNNCNGLVWHNKADLEEGLTTLHNSRSLKESIIAAGRETVAQHYSVKNYVDNVSSLIDNID